MTKTTQIKEAINRVMKKKMNKGLSLVEIVCYLERLEKIVWKANREISAYCRMEKEWLIEAYTELEGIGQ